MRHWIMRIAAGLAATAVVMAAHAADPGATPADDLRQQVHGAPNVPLRRPWPIAIIRPSPGSSPRKRCSFPAPTPLRGRQQVVEWWARYLPQPAGSVLVGARRSRGARFGDVGAQFRAGPRCGRQADRPLHLDLAPGGARRVARGVRQGQSGLQLPEAVTSVQQVPGSRMLRSTVLISVRPQNAIVRSSSLWMMFSALRRPPRPWRPDRRRRRGRCRRPWRPARAP